ncbi:hypothetical protein [Phytoactinopolyspora mesophila]|uniref:Uncharacterized protein n=1 Tax=Phytoactinopolyspora mesophila TaxID=2650750 RepID=A0A7K3M6N0_9ACTN|nr:hypothetical protein [Phytoactinopolyspora mesophila]NDL58974.1 hypothetical protein [Phytoactinopolyspora mesophila]
MPARRHATRGRRAPKRQVPPAATPSMAEITVYALLAAGVATALLLAADQPWWAAAGVVLGTLLTLALLAVATARTRRPPPAATDHGEEPARPSRSEPGEPNRRDSHRAQDHRPGSDDDTDEAPPVEPGPRRAGARRRRHKR